MRIDNKASSPMVAAIILIAVTIAVSFAVAAWMGSITFTFMKTETSLDVYDPRNSTLQQAYDHCIEELQRRNYAIYEAKFHKDVWVQAENFTYWLSLTYQYNVSVVFVNPPPCKTCIWFNYKLPTNETVTVYYELQE